MNILQVISVLGFSAIAGILYHLGGIGAPYNTKFRDLGIPTCMLLVMAILGLFHWTLALCFGTVFGVQTTYWKKISFGSELLMWTWCGFFFGLAMLPFAIHSGCWLGFGIRTMITTLFTPGWSLLMGEVAWEESGRGFIQIATLPLLLVG